MSSPRPGRKRREVEGDQGMSPKPGRGREVEGDQGIDMALSPSGRESPGLESVSSSVSTDRTSQASSRYLHRFGLVCYSATWLDCHLTIINDIKP